jgi:hypothetical protein
MLPHNAQGKRVRINAHVDRFAVHFQNKATAKRAGQTRPINAHTDRFAVHFQNKAMSCQLRKCLNHILLHCFTKSFHCPPLLVHIEPEIRMRIEELILEGAFGAGQPKVFGKLIIVDAR